jgi:hypothetical protein
LTSDFWPLTSWIAGAARLRFGTTFDSECGVEYPFAVVVATGKVNPVSGQAWTNTLGREPQNYMVVPEQPWLDGYCVEEGIIRQFVAMPLGAGYTAEEQVTGRSEYGGLQIMAFPMKRYVYTRRFRKLPHPRWTDDVQYAVVCECPAGMGLAPGGRMRQEVYEDPYDLSDWDTEHASRCFVHIANSLVWRQTTGRNPPTTPPTAKEYTAAGLPWFEWYGDPTPAIRGSTILAKLKSVVQIGKEQGDVPLPENQSVAVANVVKLRANLRPGQVREFAGEPHL